MHIQRQTLDIHAKTLCWHGPEALVDWTRVGSVFGLDGSERQVGKYGFDGPFDRAIASADGTYVFLYHNLGTKGLLLKNGELLREINRSYYHADDYEYPAAFATLGGATYLIHCPKEYCQLDFEDVETGQLVTDVPGREPGDCFHSRLEVSPGGRYLLSKGWLWHPWDVVQAYDLAACLANPHLLDGRALQDAQPVLTPPTGNEVSTAGFVSDELVLLGCPGEASEHEEPDERLPTGCIAFWNLRTNELSAPVRVPDGFANLFPISERLAWDLCGHPSLLDLTTGATLASLPELSTGGQYSSIVRGFAPALVLNRATGRVAVRLENAVEVLSVAD